MITYQVETVRDILEEIKPLLHMHFEEISAVKQLTPLDPDYDRYLAMCDAGLIHVATARDDGRLIGYFVTFVAPSLHYQHLIYGLNDILFLLMEYRGGTTAYRLFRFAIDDLQNNCGVSVISVHMKIKHEFRRILTKLGFKLVEETWELHT